MGANFMDVTNLIVGGAFGGDWTLFAIISLAIIAIMAFKWRLPASLALGMGWALVYGFYIIPTIKSTSIELILALLTVGLAISIISGLLKYGARSQN